MKELLVAYTNKFRLFFRLSFFALLFIISYIAFLPNYNALPEMASLSDIFNHFIAFFVLALFLDLAYVPKYKILIISLLLYGLFIECVQYFLPNRAFDLLDVLVDSSGIFIYIFSKFIFNKR